MTARQRWAVLALLFVLGALTAGLTAQVGLWAGPPPITARTAQLTGPAAPAPPLQGSPQPVDPPAPQVLLRVRVPASAAPGEEIEYRIGVENRSRAEAHHVIVRNPLPPNVRFLRATPEPSAPAPELAWNLDTLPGGACREIVLVVAATGPGDINNCARVQFEHGQCVTTRIGQPMAPVPVPSPQPVPTPAPTPVPTPVPTPPATPSPAPMAALSVRKCGPAQGGLDEVLTYQIAVTNRGGAPAINVSIIDKLPEGLQHASGKSTLTWSLGALAPGECKSVDYQVTARKGGRLCSHAAASADGGAFDEAESCVLIGGVPGPPTAVIPPVPAAPQAAGSLSLVKAGPQQRYVNRPASYQITVSNTGRTVLTNVVITDVLPAQTTLVSVSDAGRLTGNQVQWLIGTLQPGARRTVQLALQAPAPGEVVNRATATANGGVTAQADARTLFEGAAGLTFDLEVKDNPIEVGAQTAYLVTVHNQGMVPATNVQIAVTLPEHVQFLDAKGPVKFRPQGQQVIFEPLPALPARGEERFEIIVKAVREGEAKARAELRAEQLGDRPVLREQSTTIYSDTPGNRLQPVPGN